MHETYCTPSAPSRRGVLAGTGFAGIATAQLFAAQAGAAGTSATLDRLKRAERDAAHQDNYIAVFMPPIRADGPKQEVRPGVLKSSGCTGTRALVMARSREFLPPPARRAGKNSRSDF